MGDLGLVATHVAVFAPSVVGKHGSRAQSHKQQHPSNRSFHTLHLLRNPADSASANTAVEAELCGEVRIEIKRLKTEHFERTVGSKDSSTRRLSAEGAEYVSL